MRIALSISILALLGSSAFAADAVFTHEPAPVAPVAVTATTPVRSYAFDWSGAYIGVDGGYGWAKLGASSPLTGTEGKLDAKNWFGGLYAGYNAQFDRWVLGVEGDAQYTRMKAETASKNFQIGPKFFGTARLRTGYSFGRVLPYATGGVAIAKMKGSAEGADNFDKTQIGYTLGAGLDYAITDQWVGKLEYQYLNFGKKTYTLSSGASGDLDFNAHTVRVGLSYKF